MHRADKSIFRGLMAALMIAVLLTAAGCGRQADSQVGGAQEDRNNITIYGYIHSVDGGTVEIDQAELVSFNNWQRIESLRLQEEADYILGGYLYNQNEETRSYPLAADCMVSLYAGGNQRPTADSLTAGLQDVENKAEQGMEDLAQDMKDMTEDMKEDLSGDTARNNTASGDTARNDGATGKTVDNNTASGETVDNNTAAGGNQDMHSGALAQLQQKIADNPRIPYRICIRDGVVHSISECQYHGR